MENLAGVGSSLAGSDFRRPVAMRPLLWCAEMWNDLDHETDALALEIGHLRLAVRRRPVSMSGATCQAISRMRRARSSSGDAMTKSRAHEVLAFCKPGIHRIETGEDDGTKMITSAMLSR